MVTSRLFPQQLPGAQLLRRIASCQMEGPEQCTECSSRPPSPVSCKDAACCLSDRHTSLRWRPVSWHLSHLLSARLQAVSVRLHTKCCWRPGTTAPETLHTRAGMAAAGRAGEACWQSCCRCQGPATGCMAPHKSLGLQGALCHRSMCMLAGQRWPTGRAAAGMPMLAPWHRHH